MATTTKAAPKRSTSTKKASELWSDEERAAMKEAARERRRVAKLGPEEQRAAGEADVQAVIAALPDEERVIAARMHELISTAAPVLVPRTFYGMPAYARDGKVICFFQSKSKFKVRYYTFGFQQDAWLDDEEMWPTAFAITKLTPAVEQRVTELARRAAGQG